MSIQGYSDWLETPQGRYVLDWERHKHDQLVADIFGFNAIQLGLPALDYLRANRMPFQFRCDDRGGSAEVRSDLHHLPFAANSLDLVVLPHVLEFDENPHQVLREVERILVPEGSVVVTGFNPFSLWGAKRRLSRRKELPPWRGRYISVSRLKDWFALLGLEPRAGAFGCYAPAVTQEKWLRRFQQLGLKGLREHSRAHLQCPHKTSPEIEQQVLALREKLPTFGAARLKREFDLPISHMAIQRIWREHGLIRKRRKKYKRKQDLASVKATWRLFQQISADTKDLCDIPLFWPQAQSLHLPLVEYTAREVRSGLLFWAFAQKRSAAASAVFAARIQQHLDRWGVNLRDLAWQTDNGSEFIGGHDPLPSHWLSRRSRRQPASAHPARRAHLSERCRNRSSLGRR